VSITLKYFPRVLPHSVLAEREMADEARRRKGFFTGVPARVKWLVYLTSFSSIGYGYLLTVISAYLPELGVSSANVGLLLGTNGAAMVIAAIPFGLLADRIGRKRILILGLCGLPPVLLIYALTRDFGFLLIGSVAAGIFESAFLSTWNALIADQTGKENRNAAFSLSFVVNSVTTGIGFGLPIVFPAVQSATGASIYTVHITAFALLAVLSALTPVALYFLLRDYKEEHIVAPTLVKGRSIRILWKFSITNGMIGLGAGFIIPLIPTWMFLRYGIPDTYTGPLLAVAGITIAFAALFSARLAGRYGPVRAIVMTQGSSTIFMVLMPFMPSAAPAAGVYLIRSSLMNMSGPIGDAYLMGIISKEERGLASAINSIIWRLPNSISTVAGGLLLAAGIFDLPFFIAAAFYVTAITAFYFLFRNIEPHN
jgi:MFS family permease